MERRRAGLRLPHSKTVWSPWYHYQSLKNALRHGFEFALELELIVFLCVGIILGCVAIACVFIYRLLMVFI